MLPRKFASSLHTLDWCFMDLTPVFNLKGVRVSNVVIMVISFPWVQGPQWSSFLLFESHSGVVFMTYSLFHVDQLSLGSRTPSGAFCGFEPTSTCLFMLAEYKIGLRHLAPTYLSDNLLVGFMT